MNRKKFVFAVAFFILATPGLAAPTLSVIPGGIQGGNWGWDVSITPDLVLAQGSTPLAVELGFRLTNAPLLSVTNVNPSEFDFNIAGRVIFGWETLYGPGNLLPEGLEINCTGCTATNPATFGGHAATVVLGTANEIFAAFGSIIFNTPGPKPFLQITALGPGNGGSSSSSIQWLGVYAVGQGRIAQATGPFSSDNFDIFSGSDTQTIPEPASSTMLALGGIAVTMGFAARRRRPARTTGAC